jgi:hypothetical protein
MCLVGCTAPTPFSTGTPLSCVTLYTLSQYDSGPSTTAPQAECVLLRCSQPRPHFTGHPPQLQQRVASHTRGYGSPGSLAGGARGAARAAASSAADELRGLYARLTERYCTKLDDNHCKQLFEYLKGAQQPQPVTFIIDKRLYNDRLADALMRLWSEGCGDARWTALVLSHESSGWGRRCGVRASPRR